MFCEMCSILCLMIEALDANCIGEHRISCGEDEFVDTTVCACSSCVDICQPRPDKSTLSDCQGLCPGYYGRFIASGENSYKLEKKLQSVPIDIQTKDRSTVASVGQTQEVDSLIRKPLFWTSVVSVFISVVATGVLIILCSCRKTGTVRRLHQRRRLLLSQTATPRKELEEKSRRAEGTLKIEDGTNLPRFTPQLESSKEAMCGNFPVSVGPSYSHCDYTEAISSIYLSSYLQNPCVASVEDPLRRTVSKCLHQQSHSGRSSKREAATYINQIHQETGVHPGHGKWITRTLFNLPENRGRSISDSGYVDAGSCASSTGVTDEPLFTPFAPPVPEVIENRNVQQVSPSGHALQKANTCAKARHSSELNMQVRSCEGFVLPELMALVDVRDTCTGDQCENDEETGLKSTRMNMKPKNTKRNTKRKRFTV